VENLSPALDPALQRLSLDDDRKSEIDAHFGVAIASVAAALSGAILTTLIVGWAGALRASTALPWLGFMLAMGALHIGAALVYQRAPAWRTDWRIWAALTTVITLVEGVGWGFAPFALVASGDVAAMFLVMLVTFCVSAGSVIGYGRYLPTRVVAFVAPTTPYLVYSAFASSRIVRGSFFLTLLFLVAIGHLGLTADRSFRREAAMRRRNARMALDLRRQKDKAEHASLAKSRFLAAASHDLRQPIHTLGLHVGVLKDSALTPDSRALVGKMEGSIAAMDRLFAAILDISRLDAGVVAPQVETFALDELIARVCDEFRAEAERKGLRVILKPSRLVVRSDPVLVERILRNFVSNAVRYAAHGGVIVRARRRGEEAALAVWDSGRGVPRDQLEHIFEEYVQLDNPERDREKGLGLGLAIVRRLAALLGAPVEAASRVGRGSRFGVRLPLGDPGEIAHRESDAERPMGAGLVIVVEDEAAVRDAMRTALAAWRLDVVEAASGAAALALAEGLTPSLLLCDYRLPRGEDGLDVVARFRAAFGEGLPAILVTGDTAPERIADAHAHGVRVLHKPVIHARLRAAVAEALAPLKPAGGARRASATLTPP
jgi:signal transduction histidine kinase/CheY-like chemotaxis protein